MFSFPASTMGEAIAESWGRHLESHFRLSKASRVQELFIFPSYKELPVTEFSAWVNTGIGHLVLDKNMEITGYQPSVMIP